MSTESSNFEDSPGPSSAPSGTPAVCRACSFGFCDECHVFGCTCTHKTVEAEREFLAASIAVWREIDRLSDQPGGYRGLDAGTALRQAERQAWERYRSFLDADSLPVRGEAAPSASEAPEAPKWRCPLCGHAACSSAPTPEDPA